MTAPGSTPRGTRPARGTGLVVPERVRWAVQVLDPGPAEQILEIGGGPGVAAALVCERLTTGRLLVVDRSRVAVQRTAQRTAAHLASGRLAVQQSSLDALSVPPHSFDKAFAVNVNLFWMSGANRELTVLSQALRPQGILHVFYGATGPTAADRITTAVSTALHAHAFTDVAITSAEAGIGISARAPATSPVPAAPRAGHRRATISPPGAQASR